MTHIPPEVLAAAERLRNKSIGDHMFHHSKDQALLADYALSLIVEQEEGREAVTEEWLRSIGFVNHRVFSIAIPIPRAWTQSSRCYLVCEDYANAESCPWSVFSEYVDGTADSAMIVEECSTRAEVLTLLAALRIEVKHG